MTRCIESHWPPAGLSGTGGPPPPPFLATADGLRAQAGVARAGAEDLELAQHQVLDLVDAVHAQGFVVGEDFTVSDANAYPPMIAARRQEVAAGHTAALRAQVHNLAGTDAEVAGNLNRGVQAVDFRTAPQPTDGPSPQPSPSPSSSGDDIAKLMLPRRRLQPRRALRCSLSTTRSWGSWPSDRRLTRSYWKLYGRPTPPTTRRATPGNGRADGSASAAAQQASLRRFRSSSPR